MKPALTWLLFSSSPELGAAAGVVISAALLCAAFFVVLLERGRVYKFPLRNASWIAMAYLMWSVISLCWTGADSVWVGVIYWLGAFADAATVLVLLSVGVPEVLSARYIRGLVVGALSLVLIVFLSSERMGDGRIGNELLHPNTLGKQLSLGAVASLFIVFNNLRPPRFTKFWIAAFAMIVVALLATLSKTSIVAFGLAFVIFGLLSRGVRGSYFLLALVVSGLVSLMLPLLEGYVGLYLGSSNGSMETLSGRTDLWKSTWDMIPDRWLLGYGYLSFRDVGPLVFTVRVPHAHNDFLQQWFSLGVIGLLLALATYLAAGLAWWRNGVREGWRNIDARVGLALLVLLFVRGLTEAEVVGLMLPLPLLFLLLSRTPANPAFAPP